MHKTLQSRCGRSAARALTASLAACVLCVAGCATQSPGYRNQQTFESPAKAVEALVAAARKGETTELEAIFGPDGSQILSSGDPVMDRSQLGVFVVAMDAAWTLEPVSDNEQELVVGYEEWPFPIPLIKDSRGWWFDTPAGAMEILARRIGRNELAVIGTLEVFVIAQEEYASEGHDGKPAGLYAQKNRSSPGMHDGLYWAVTSPDEAPSPLSELAAEATLVGYSGEATRTAQPYQGYFFRILTRQGPDAPGGTMDYVVDGHMTEGFAAVAYPAEYENSGIMTFLVGADGIVYEADLGPETSAVAGAIESYNPDDRWRRVE